MTHKLSLFYMFMRIAYHEIFVVRSFNSLETLQLFAFEPPYSINQIIIIFPCDLYLWLWLYLVHVHLQVPASSELKLKIQ